MTRKHFLAAAVTSVGGALMGSCGEGEDNYDYNGANTASGDCTELISDNHDHVLQVTHEEVLAAVEKTYDIKGGATHNHRVTITVANFATLASHGSVILVSTVTSSHSHTITVSCA